MSQKVYLQIRRFKENKHVQKMSLTLKIKNAIKTELQILDQTKEF